MLKKCLRHFSPAHGASTNIKDSLVLLCGKAFKSELNSALLSSCAAFSPLPYFSSGYFPSLPSSDLTASSSFIYYFFFLLISSPSLSLHLVGTVLSLLLSWVNMIKSSEGSLRRSGRGSRTARVMPGARGAAGCCFGSTTCLTAAPLIWPPRALSLSLSVLRGRINRADGNILFPAGSIR